MNRSEEERVKKYLDVGHSVVENHARTQQKTFESHLGKRDSVTRVISEFLKTNFFGFVYHYVKSRFGKRHAYQFYPAGDDRGVYPIQSLQPNSEEVAITLLSDWASDTAESDQVGFLVAEYAPDYTIHLGDIYFVGTPSEVAENFTAPHASWHYGSSGSLVLMGNHEMYSNGNAFFQQLLPAMFVTQNGLKVCQKAGFFCLENAHWRVIGLDTGYTSVGRPILEVLSPPDCHLKMEQVAWLRDTVKIGDPADKRGIILLSHHPYYSAFRDAYPIPAEQINELLGTEADRHIIWFWGHDHRLVLYNPMRSGNGPMAYGRCIGHGGLPVEIAPPKTLADKKIILAYDQRKRKVVNNYQLGYNGFALLKLKGTTLCVQYVDIEDNVVAEEKWEVNMENGQLNWQVTKLMPELSIS